MSDAGVGIYVGFGDKGAIVEMTKEEKIAEMRGFGFSEDEIEENIGRVEAPEPNVAGEETVRINESGHYPIEFKVLVKDDEDETLKQAARAGIVIPDTASERYKAGTTKGVIVAMSPLAFSYAEWPEGARLPKVGDHVVFARYAGMKTKGRPYTNERGHVVEDDLRLLNDKDIASILEF